MLRAFLGLSVLTLAATAAAQEVPQVYQQQKTTTAFHIDGVTRQEWNSEEITFNDHSRRLYRFKPRVELSAKWLQLGVGGDFVYGSDDNLAPPPGEATRALVRDNYDSRDARLDLAFAKVIPAAFFSAEGGRFPMPVRFTEMIWDRDLRAQGGATVLSFGSVGAVKQFALTGVYARGSHILPQEGAFKFDKRDTVWIGSATTTFSAGAKDTIELIGSYVKFTDLRFVDPRLRRQNTRVDGVLVRPYGVLDFVFRYHGEGKVNTTLVADYAWNQAVERDNKGLWVALVLGSLKTAHGAMEYTYATVDKDATLAAYNSDDFFWGTGWSGHRLDFGVRISDRASSHVIGQLQKFKDSGIELERTEYRHRIRLEVRVSY
jgi:hypothetical protein